MLKSDLQKHDDELHEVIMNLVADVQGIKLAIEEGKFKISQSENDLLKLFQRRQSPLNQWLYETDMRLGDLHTKKCIILYKQFMEWFNANGYAKAMTNFTFKEDICALYDMEIRNMKIEESQVPVQVFFKPGDFDKDYKPF